MVLKEGMPDARLRGRNPTKERRNRGHHRVVEKPPNSKATFLTTSSPGIELQASRVGRSANLSDYNIILSILVKGVVDGGNDMSQSISLSKSVSHYLKNKGSLSGRV